MGRRNRVRYGEIRHPGLDHHPRIVELHRQDSSQPREHDQHPIRHGQRAARKPGARTTGHPRNARLKAGSDNCLDLIRRSGQHGGYRCLAVMAESVRAVCRERVRMGQNVLRAADPLQMRHQLRGGIHRAGVSRITVVASLRAEAE